MKIENGFYVDYYEGEFEARFDVRGTVTRSIKAPDIKAAQEAAWDMAEDEDDFLEIDDVDDLRIVGVAPRTPRYLVARDGQKMRVSRLQDGDAPREPDERGF